MPKKRVPQLKNPELYEELREEGHSKEKSARISNAVAKRGQKSVARAGGKARSYETWTVKDLRERAREIGITGYSSLKKAELIRKIRHH